MTPREEAIAAVAREFAGSYDEGTVVTAVFGCVGLDPQGDQTLVEYPWNLDCVPGMVAEWALPERPAAIWTRVAFRGMWYGHGLATDATDDPGFIWMRYDADIPDDAILRWDPRWIIGQERPDA